MSTQERLSCIFCGRSVVLRQINLDRMDNYEIDWKVIQFRQMLAGPGRGKKGKNSNSGFPVIKDAGLSIVEMSKDLNYQEYVEAIKERLIKIVKAYVQAGIIKPSELRVRKK